MMGFFINFPNLNIRYILAGIAALLIGVLGIWSWLASTQRPAVAPAAAASATSSPASATSSPDSAPVATHKIVAYAAPGADPVLTEIPVEALAVARCLAWPQLVLTYDAAGNPWWVNQDAATPDPSKLDADGLLPADPQPACAQ